VFKKKGLKAEHQRVRGKKGVEWVYDDEEGFSRWVYEVCKAENRIRRGFQEGSLEMVGTR
jgi:hypothetical protein